MKEQLDKDLKVSDSLDSYLAVDLLNIDYLTVEIPLVELIEGQSYGHLCDHILNSLE